MVPYSRRFKALLLRALRLCTIRIANHADKGGENGADPLSAPFDQLLMTLLTLGSTEGRLAVMTFAAELVLVEVVHLHA